MSKSRQKRLVNRKRRMAHRLRPRNWSPQDKPMLTASNIHYESSDRVRGLGSGGIGAMHLLARQTGLIDAIDAGLHVLKVHLPYHESDHVLNIAYNSLCGGTCLEDIELRRNDEVYLDALGAQRIPDPTTAGDFCRRFEAVNVVALMEGINETRLGVWAQQPDSFFEEAILDMDGTIVPTLGECKEGMDLSYKGEWGYGPLLLSLANTGEPLYVVNRGANRPSHEGAADWTDKCIALFERAGFRRILLRGDTDFSQTTHLDRWDDADNVRFIFGIDAMPNLKAIAEDLSEKQWKPLHRRAKHTVKTKPRQRPENVKEKIVREREFQNIRLQSEQVASFDYQPTACRKTYRMVVVRKNLSVEKGDQVLFDDIRYFFYITNDRVTPDDEIVFLANGRASAHRWVI